MLASPTRLCRPCRLAGPAHPAATAGFSIQEGEIPRETDCLLEEDGFEPSVPAGDTIFRKPAGSQNRILMIDEGRFTMCRAGLAPANDINAGPCQPARFRALTRPVPGDSVLQVVDMRDTAIGGHRDYAIAHDLACPPGHFVNRIGAQMVVYFLFLTAGVRDRRKS
jgi:hypothetical protein